MLKLKQLLLVITFTVTAFVNIPVSFASVDVNEIRPVYFPAVPEGWKISLIGNSVEYEAPKLTDSNADPTFITFTYTKNTAGKDAKSFSQNYSSKNSCQSARKLGYGFYTIRCPIANRYVIIVGEPNNLYQIELTGTYTDGANALISDYVNKIISGKHVFRNRFIGDTTNTDEE